VHYDDRYILQLNTLQTQVYSTPSTVIPRTTIAGNDRPVQDLNGRQVYRASSKQQQTNSGNSNTLNVPTRFQAAILVVYFVSFWLHVMSI